MPDTITTEFLALRDRYIASCFTKLNPVQQQAVFTTCLLYTSDAADD